MRKKSFAIILSLLLVLPLSISITSASYKDESNKEIYADDSNIGFFNNGKAEKTKQITYRNKTFDVKYVNTINMSNILPENRKDSFCTYDIYSDEENTEYLFVYNTDILCGIKDENMSLPFDSAKCISQQSAILLSIEYLNKLYGYDITKSYVFDFCRYDENAGLFDVRFYKSLGSYKTDDEIKVWVRSDGSVAGFSAFNINRYDKYGDKALKIDEAIKGSSTLETKTKSMNIINYRIKESYITLNDNGDLAYVNMIEYDIYSGTSILQECEKIEQIINIQ
jgi:hypothetical protein